MSTGNLLANPCFAAGDDGAPDHWRAEGPRPELRPRFAWEPGALAIAGGSHAHGFGYWSQRVAVTGGRSYGLKVRFRVEGIFDLNLHVLNLVLWARRGRTLQHCPHDHISHYTHDGETIVGAETFQVPDDVEHAYVQLGLRSAPGGSVVWTAVELSEVEPRQARPVRVTAMRWRAERGSSLLDNHNAIGALLDRAAERGSDLVLLPEYATHNGTGVPAWEAAEPVPDGVTCRLLSEGAKAHRMYVCCGLLERSGDDVFNTAVLFDREGQFAGRYRKVHPYWPEAFWDGISPGGDFPVFKLDFGTVGVIICYDSWYAETARVLALKGAELILLPNAGYEPLLIPARAIDNRAYVAVSSLGGPTMIVDTCGRCLAEAADGLVTADIDLAYRPSPHANAGGSLNASAGGRRGVRHAADLALYDEIRREIGTWQDRPESFTWMPRRD